MAPCADSIQENSADWRRTDDTLSVKMNGQSGPLSQSYKLIEDIIPRFELSSPASTTTMYLLLSPSKTGRQLASKLSYYAFLQHTVSQLVNNILEKLNTV